MGKLFEKVFDLVQSRQVLASRRYGMIQVSDGKLDFVQLRPWPKLISSMEASWLGGWRHNNLRRDRMRIYYNQPMGHRRYLALKYIVSSLGTTLATGRTAMQVLDEIARCKRSDAILCEVTNRRITDRVLNHFGYERHLPNSRKRHFIRRFYGDYPLHAKLLGDQVAGSRVSKPASELLTQNG